MKKILCFLVLLSLLVLVSIVVFIRCFEEYQISAYGSIIAAAGSLLAVIWFTASLWYQSVQLNEQRIQFTAEFRTLKEASRRESLVIAKNIIDDSEKKAISACGCISSISELLPQYMSNFKEIGIIMESTDPMTVMKVSQSWMKIETAANIYLKGIKSAAEIYLESIDAQNINYNISPEEFVYVYSPYFQKLPFFNAMEGIVSTLGLFMYILQPGRKGVIIAMIAASVKSLGSNIIDMDKLKEMIKEQKEKGHIIPNIAKDLNL
ncbi:MAG: hypothetical protein PHG70_08150 [Synergistaceae bacterium]|nr:hypothetical protein [Synergistaceae bacterium]